MNTSDLQALVRGRRAIRRYQDRPIPADMLERLLTAATWAPSAHNRQPWRFAVLATPAARETLAAAMGERLFEDRVADGDPLLEVQQDVARSYARIAGAPLVIVFFLTMNDMDRYPDERRMEAEYQMAVQSVAMAAQTMWLTASAEGLGACWLCAPLFVPDLVAETLGVPDDWHAQGLMTLGWPDEERAKGRRPWPELTTFL